MARNSADPLHGHLQDLLVGIVENVPLPDNSWSCHATTERLCEHYGRDYYPDVYVQWVKRGSKGGNYKVYIEIQKEMGCRTFLDKIEVYKHLVRERNIYTYLVINENEMPEKFWEVTTWLREQIEMNILPW